MAVPEAVRPLLDGLVGLGRERFGERWVATYCVGSLAHGGWSIRLSDVDGFVVLEGPLRDSDGPALVGLGGELAESYPRFGPRLSLFWATEAILMGTATGGRLGPIEAADLVQNGQLLSGAEVRSRLRAPEREELRAAMAAEMNERWRLRLSPFHVREALEEGRGEELDERSLTRACLHPARFLHTAETGRIASPDEAADDFAARYGEERAEAVRFACELRHRSQGPDASASERKRLAAAFHPLFELFFAEIGRRFGLPAPRG